LENRGLQDRVRQLKVVSDSNQKNILKGYILSHCDLNPELTRFFYKIPEITGFLNHQRGDDKLPNPVSESLVKNFLAKAKEKKENKPESYQGVDLKVGDLVKITEGTFINREGRITHLDPKKQKVKITIESSG
ncbi:4002_t:CDS:1, partial [Ambispora gerdemannii]